MVCHRRAVCMSTPQRPPAPAHRPLTTLAMTTKSLHMLVGQAINTAVGRDADIVLTGDDIAAFSACCRSSIRQGLQASAWRVRAHAARRQVQLVSTTARAELRDMARIGRRHVAIVERVGRLLRSNTDFRGTVVDRVQHVIAGFGVFRYVIDHMKGFHPELRAEIADAERRADVYLGVDVLASDLTDVSDEDSEGAP